MPASTFRRQDLAQRLAAQILDAPAASAARSGLFLAAPRRTGKSTFIREDLRPALQERGAVTLYADLWEDRKADPGDIIVGVIRQALASLQPALARVARSLGIESASVGAVKLSLDRIGLGKDVSLTAALVALSDEVRRPIVLIIDEAQHAITSSAGSEALFALKAARDELNSSKHHGLRIVATGSNQDKLAMLRGSKDQPFFGAPLVPFPPLGRDFIAWFCQNVNLPAALDPDNTYALFEQAGWRPEILGAATDVLRFDLATTSTNMTERFEQAVREQIASANAESLRVVHSLPPLQSAVLRVAAEQAQHYAPFEAQTMKQYARRLKAAGAANATTPDNTNVQQALIALQDKGLVWRAARGVYALEDGSLAALLLTETPTRSTPRKRAQRQK